MFDALLGNASEVKPNDIQRELSHVLLDEEKVEKAYKVIRDLYVFTNKRLLLVDRQGFTGNKVEYHSIPYKSISHFAVETAGHFDRDSELKLWLSGGHFFQKELKKGVDIVGLQQTLAMYILK